MAFWGHLNNILLCEAVTIVMREITEIINSNTEEKKNPLTGKKEV